MNAKAFCDFLNKFKEGAKPIPPKFGKSQILACFADLRGSTESVRLVEADMRNDYVRKFIKAYMGIFEKAIWKAIWVNQTEPTVKSIYESPLRPKTLKFTGDGMMIVWDLEKDDKVVSELFDILTYIQGYFAAMMDHPKAEEEYGKPFQSVELGFGVARGEALAIFGPLHTQDYVGTTVNLAARLEAQARPRGIVAKRDVANLSDVEYMGWREESLPADLIKGFGDSIDIWRSRRSTLPVLSVPMDDDKHPWDFEGMRFDELISLVPDELLMKENDLPAAMYPENANRDVLLGFRKAVEIRTASKLAERVGSMDFHDRNTTLSPIWEVIKRMETEKGKNFTDAGKQFHVNIATAAYDAKCGVYASRLWTDVQRDYLEKPELVDTAYRQAVNNEHTTIFRAIDRGDADAAEHSAREHLRKQWKRDRRLRVR